MSASTRSPLATAVAAFGLIVAACTSSSETFVPADAGVITSIESSPTDTTFVLSGGRQLTLDTDVRWLSGFSDAGDLLLAGTSPTRWAMTLGGNIEGPGGLKPCFSISGAAWDRGDHLEISYGTGDGPVTLSVPKSPAWIPPDDIQGIEQSGTYTCLDANGRAVTTGWTGL